MKSELLANVRRAIGPAPAIKQLTRDMVAVNSYDPVSALITLQQAGFWAILDREQGTVFVADIPSKKPRN
jgi:hypothetical protein